MKKKEEEVVHKQAIEKEKAAELKMEIIKYKKEIDGRRVTCDANGNLVNIKSYMVEKVANDFVSAK
jgi:hypothetical protein